MARMRRASKKLRKTESPVVAEEEAEEEVAEVEETEAEAEVSEEEEEVKVEMLCPFPLRREELTPS